MTTDSTRIGEQSRTSPSPSPPPRPPVSLTPGPRAKALQRIFDSALRATLKTVSYQNFSACFPTPAASVPDALSGLHRDFIDRLSEVCKNEFESLLQERNVVRNLNELDVLVDEAEKRRVKAGTDAQIPRPPHMLPPVSLLNAHFSSCVQSQSADLTSQLRDVQQSNGELINQVVSQREEISALMAGLEGAIRDVDGAIQTLGPQEVQGNIEEFEAALSV